MLVKYEYNGVDLEFRVTRLYELNFDGVDNETNFFIRCASRDIAIAEFAYRFNAVHFWCRFVKFEVEVIKITSTL